MISRRLALAATGLAAATVLTACGGSSSGSAAGSGMDHMSSTAAPGTSAASSADASRQGDIDFAQSMIPHHEQAVEMADLALKNASAAQVKALATQIKGAQDPEIETMKGWLAAWGADETMAGMDMGGVAMPGMMSETDMTALADAGADFDTMWLTMMTTHHQGAITMAKEVLATTADPHVTTLAQAVVDGQTREIETIKGLLAG